MNPAAPGQTPDVEEIDDPATSEVPEERSPGEPEVTLDLDGDTARITVAGELTDAARRPLVRLLTDLLLSHAPLNRIELRLRAVTFMNSAGMGVLVQVQRMTAPRGVELVLVDPPAVVTRPLERSGLWHRFEIVEAGQDDARPDAGDR